MLTSAGEEYTQYLMHRASSQGQDEQEGTMKHHRTALRGLLAGIALGSVSFVLLALPHGEHEPVRDYVDPIATMIDDHGCWSGLAPVEMEGKMPGHVVVTLPNQVTVYGGPKLVKKSLEQVFSDVDHGLVVRAFCR